MNKFDEYNQKYFSKQYEKLEILGFDKSVINKFMLLSKDVINIIINESAWKINIDSAQEYMIADYIDIIKKLQLSGETIDDELCIILINCNMCSKKSAKYLLEYLAGSNDMYQLYTLFKRLFQDPNERKYVRAKDVMFDIICDSLGTRVGTHSIKLLLSTFTTHKIRSTLGLIKVINKLSDSVKKEILKQILETPYLNDLLITICNQCSYDLIDEVLHINTIYYRFMTNKLQLFGRTLDNSDPKDIEYVSKMINDLNYNKNYKYIVTKNIITDPCFIIFVSYIMLIMITYGTIRYILL
jgi:hypothetical protein